jgi:hypothetical protein
LKKLLFILIISIITTGTAFPQEKVLAVGEELIYRVYFGFIRLGQVKFKLTNHYIEKGEDIYTAIAEIKSYEGIPFISLNYLFETQMSTQSKKAELYSRQFYSTEFKDKSITRIEYTFEYDKAEIKIQKETDGRIENFEKVKIENSAKYQDGLSLFYNARMQSFGNQNYNIPVYINEKESSVKYSFNMNEDVVSTDAIDYHVAVIKIAGVADFVGLFGLTGEFISWLSADEARIPIKAQFNVSIGSISLELEKYKRTGWEPPKFTN